MIERIENLRAELQLRSLSNLEHLDETEVQVPVVWSSENVAPRSVRSRGRQGESVLIRKKHWASEGLSAKLLQSRPNRRINDQSPRDVRIVVCARAAGYAERLARHE